MRVYNHPRRGKHRFVGDFYNMAMICDGSFDLVDKTEKKNSMWTVIMIEDRMLTIWSIFCNFDMIVLWFHSDSQQNHWNIDRQLVDCSLAMKKIHTFRCLNNDA